MAGDKGDEELRKKNGMERRKCYFALHVSVAHFAPILFTSVAFGRVSGIELLLLM